MLSSSAPSQSYASLLKRKEYAVVLSKNNATVNRLLLTSGIVGSLYFMLVMIVEGATHPGYNAWTMAGSSLSLSSYGRTQIANFIIDEIVLVGTQVSGVPFRRLQPPDKAVAIVG
jgi:nicotinamide riboside transporter PnuC